MIYVSFVTLGLLEERAILLGKLGDHKKALSVYVHVLHDFEAAEK